jgi:hypothetical protein
MCSRTVFLNRWSLTPSIYKKYYIIDNSRFSRNNMNAARLTHLHAQTSRSPLTNKGRYCVMFNGVLTTVQLLQIDGHWHCQLTPLFHICINFSDILIIIRTVHRFESLHLFTSEYFEELYWSCPLSPDVTFNRVRVEIHNDVIWTGWRTKVMFVLLNKWKPAHTKPEIRLESC